MPAYDWLLPARVCPAADSLSRTAQFIFHTLPGSVTPELIAAALEALGQYRAALAVDLDPMHYGIPVGTHVCVEDIYQEAKARLFCLAATAKPAEPPLPPAPEPVMTLEDVVKAFGEPVQPSDDATYLGTDEDEPDAW
jgi:hypothetical protein